MNGFLLRKEDGMRKGEREKGREGERGKGREGERGKGREGEGTRSFLLTGLWRK